MRKMLNATQNIQYATGHIMHINCKNILGSTENVKNQLHKHHSIKKLIKNILHCK